VSRPDCGLRHRFIQAQRPLFEEPTRDRALAQLADRLGKCVQNMCVIEMGAISGKLVAKRPSSPRFRRDAPRKNRPSSHLQM
jgi:hypothetical protein